MAQRSDQKIRGAVLRAAVIEGLPRRILLSMSVANGTLKIVGGDSADNIVVTADPVFINVFDAKFNTATTYISIADLKKISILARGGDDVIQIDPSLDGLKLRVVVDGGDGNDRITTGAGNDVITGGAGDDKLY